MWEGYDGKGCIPIRDYKDPLEPDCEMPGSFPVREYRERQKFVREVQNVLETVLTKEIEFHENEQVEIDDLEWAHGFVCGMKHIKENIVAKVLENLRDFGE